MAQEGTRAALQPRTTRIKAACRPQHATCEPHHPHLPHLLLSCRVSLLCLLLLSSVPAEGGERELMELAIQALESGQAMSAEESMVMQSGTYGAANMVGAYGGSAGGILDSDTTADPVTSALESGESNKPATTSTPAPAPAKAKSSALSAHSSAGLLAAGVVAAVFLF